MVEQRKPLSSNPWRRIGEGLLDHIFPRWCLSCGEAVQAEDEFAHVCRACARDLHRVHPPTCKTCGHPFYGMLAGPRSCAHCAGLDPCFAEGRTLFLMRGPGRELMHQLKYKKGFYVLRDLRRLVRQNPAYLEALRGAVLVPVPLHPKKLREREYNQSELIARALAHETGPTTVVAPLLQRVRWTDSQTRLSREARRRNMDNAFAIATGILLQPKRKHVVVDDVFTTGSTVNACCQVLHDAGIRQLAVATIGHG